MENYGIDIRELLQQRILVLDGAMGTMIQEHKLNETDFRGDRFRDHPVPLQGNNDLLSLTQPGIIKDIHAGYLEVGADIVETNTFTSTSIAQADYELQDIAYELNYEAAKIAKEVCSSVTEQTPDKPRYVAGSVGPTNKTTSLSPDVSDPGYRSITFVELKDSYTEQVRGLVDGGVDILLVETVFDTLNCKAALSAIRDLFAKEDVELPVMVSGTITDSSGRTLSGQTTQAFLISISHFPLLSVGLNCALGAKALRPYLKVMASKSEFFVSAHPNAGLPNEFGEYDESPEDMSSQIEEYLQDGLVNIVGGCCGTTPAHIQAIAEKASQYRPREITVAV